VGGVPRAAAPALLLVLALSACAGPLGAEGPRTALPGGQGAPSPLAAPYARHGFTDDLPERLASRAASLVGRTGSFAVGDARFQGDCIGFVEAVYQAEGVPLRALMARTAPGERSGVAAAYRVFDSYGILFGGGGAWPAPGDLVFFHDTYDRNRNGRVDDAFTHIGIVEGVSDGRVTFLHRGGEAVARATLDLVQPTVARGADGTVVNSYLRAKPSGPVPGTQGLAGELFAGFGRLDPARLPRDVATR
jgi:probable lipoprotein NlpC